MLRQQEGSQIAAAATTSDRTLDKNSQSTTTLTLALAQAKEKIASLEQQVKQFNAAATKSGVRNNAGTKSPVAQVGRNDDGVDTPQYTPQGARQRVESIAKSMTSMRTRRKRDARSRRQQRQR